MNETFSQTFSSLFFNVLPFLFACAENCMALRYVWEEKLSLYLCGHWLSASLHAAVTCGLPVRQSSAGRFCSSVLVTKAAPCCGLPRASRDHNDTACLYMTRFSLRRYLILQEQHLLEELSQPPAPAGGYCHNHLAAPLHIYQIPSPAPQAEPPRIIQQVVRILSPRKHH